MRRKDKSLSLAERADRIRSEAESICEERNDVIEAAAKAEFEKSDDAKFIRENAKYVTGLLAFRLGKAQAGEAFEALRPFDAETLFRLLTTRSVAAFNCWTFDDGLSDEEVDGLCGEDLLDFTATGLGYTKESQLVNALVDAFSDYARAAAIYAKHVKSASLLEWVEILDILQNMNGRRIFREAFPEECAHRLIELEHSAAGRLRLERMAAALPAFRARKTGKKKAKK